ncbi:BgTH12-04473 [Blumeria graminis f. sp. triticale]|uniref:BgtE-10002 n=3 Tax=Blumeria graminis TaxID=34373 RepID=A0A061HKT6_BLUGR|nr:putative secreted effector protein [Blumeria graminis f. sp. tritici 96224]CAD6498814.1 BgTH12-04473 [Blumeria graminis f. sp. triticale]VCU38919.1 BgtE-10002 [Blumeria graminis f. sp. tritici]
MKFPISLATLAISTVASAYCVPPSPQSSIVEGQQFISEKLRIPGQNELQYCSSQFKRGPITFSDVSTKPRVPVVNQPFEVDMKGTLHVPLSSRAKIRVYDLTTDYDLTEPIDFLTYMKKNGAEVPTNVGEFHIRFTFTPQLAYPPKIGIELYNSERSLLLCVKTLLFF